MTTTTAPKTFNKIVANGTPLRSSSSILSSHHDGTENPKQISVVSYNVLAPAYVRPLDKRTGSIQSFAAFEWISEDNSHAVLSMEHRGPKLYQILSHCHADIICIQELQLERRQSKNNKNGHDNYYYGLPPWIEPLIAEHGGKYCVVLPSQTELCQIAERNRRVLDIDGAVTVAVLYRVDKFEPFSRNTTAGDENNHNNDEDTQQEATNHTSNNSHDHHKKNKGHSSSKKKNSKHKKKNSSRDQYDHTDQEGNSNRCVSICLQGVQGSDMEEIEPVVVASVHLDATDETKRVGQLTRLLKRQTTATANKYKSNPRPSFIIAGDMNTELFSGSCVSAFLRQNNDNDSNDHESFPTEEDYRQQCHESLRLTQDIEPSKEQLQQWKDMYMDVNQLVKNELCMTLSRIKSGKTRAAYDHATSTDDNTNHNKNDENNNNNNQESSTLSSNSGWRSSMMMGQWALDHMLYSTDTLRPLSVWSTLEADKEAQQSGLPNHKWPSDHLPIGAMFNIQKSPQLTVEERSVLVEQISAFEKMQYTKMKDLTDTLDAQQAQIEAESCLPTVPPQDMKEEGDHGNTGSKDNKKNKNNAKKKQKKGPPPKKVIDFMRQRRSQIRDLKVELKAQRKTKVDEMSNLERLVAKEILGCNVNQWIERAEFSALYAP